MAEEEKVAEKMDVRETPAFKGALKQVEEYKRQAADLAQQLAALNEVKARQELESKGQYEQALSQLEGSYKTRLAEREAELASIRQAHELSSIELGLAGAGITGKARAYLARDYAALGADKPEFGAWLESVKVDPEYSVFFSASQEQPARVHRPGDVAGRSAGGTSGKVDWAQVRADIRSHDPAKSGPAQRMMAEYIMANRGAAPPKE